MPMMRGFTMLEVLVTLVILMFGLLGIAGLMVQGQRTSHEAYQVTQALSLVNDMVERIKSNQGRAPDYLVDPAAAVGDGTLYDQIGSAVTDCSTTPCTAQEVAAYDVALWDGLLSGTTETVVVGDVTRVGGVINARGCIEQLNGPPVTGGPPYTYRVSVSWQGETDTQLPPDLANGGSTCGTGLYGDEATTARRRLIPLDVQVCNLDATTGFGCEAL